MKMCDIFSLEYNQDYVDDYWGINITPLPKDKYFSKNIIGSCEDWSTGWAIYNALSNFDEAVGLLERVGDYICLVGEGCDRGVDNEYIEKLIQHFLRKIKE